MLELVVTQDEKEVLKCLNIEEDKLNHYMNLFSQWIASQKHLPQNSNETCRKKFLIWAKLDFEKAKKKFQTFCYNPVMYREFSCDRALRFEDDINKAFEFFCIIPMPKLTPQGVRITCIKFFNGDSFDAMAFSRGITIHVEFKLRIDNIVAGDAAILDLECMKPQHYARMFTPTFLKIFKYAMVNHPFMVKNLLIINCHPALEKGFGLIKAILPQKIADRLMILSDSKDLAQYIPVECLPQDYGGTEKSLDHFQILWKQYYFDLKDFYVRLDKCKPAGPVPEEFQSRENEFGVDGSFRKLNID